MGIRRRYRKYLVDGKEKIPKSTLRVQRLRAKRLEESRTAQVDSPLSVPKSLPGFHQNDSPLPQMQEVEEPGCQAVPLNDQTCPAESDASGQTYHPALTETSASSETSNIKLTGPSREVTVIRDEKPTLCSHTECTADDVMLMCLILGNRHNLSWTAVVDIMKMVNAIFRTQKISASTYSLVKRFSKTASQDATFHYYCVKCKIYVSKMTPQKGDVVCDTDGCGTVVNKPKSTTYFASLSIETQLRKLLQDKNADVADMILNYRFSRKKIHADNLEDIYDGSEYKRLSSPGEPLADPSNISFSFFTDGISVGKTKKSLWPIYISINELPPKERSKYILLVGLYYGPNDPNQTMFMKPFVEEVNKLSTIGFSWLHKGLQVNSKVLPLVAVTDSVARPQLLNMQTFTAHYGCTFCYQVATHTSKRLKFTLPLHAVKPRTSESYQVDLAKAYAKRFEVQDKNRQHRGVKGPSSLASLVYFDLFKGCVVDYMHNILIGVTKTYFQLIFDNSRRKFWSMLKDNDNIAMEDVMTVVDTRLLVIQSPTHIPRTPRSIKDYLNWKANEWRSWLLFYSIPCLDGLLKPQHLLHFAMLCKATSLFLQESVSRSDINEAHELLQKFSYLYQQYFGPEHMYYNVHLLIHVADGVFRWGPLWTHNAFMYESFNRRILQMCKSPFQVVKEITRKYEFQSSLPEIVEKFAASDETLMFCSIILQKRLVKFTRSGECILMGKGRMIDELSNDEGDCLLVSGVVPNECLFYDRMLRNGFRITVDMYACNKKNNDSIIFSTRGDVLQVLKIVLHGKAGVKIIAREVLLDGECVVSCSKAQICTSVSVSHLLRVIRFGKLVTIDSCEIAGPCIYMVTGNGVFISKMHVGHYGE